MQSLLEMIEELKDRLDAIENPEIDEDQDSEIEELKDELEKVKEFCGYEG
tara:strand:- start:999 stop:1148 length:150 start_codon:yes stop_codon:yes gene_type:complete